VSLASPSLADGLRDRYTIEREVGRGGMATVYLAHDLKHDRQVALKVLHVEPGSLLGAQRFQREIRLAARLQHPHILAVYDSGETAGQLWFVMPYVDGTNLRECLRQEGQLSIAEAVRIAREAAAGLAYAGEQGVIHRDVKPENILLTRDGSVLVADFGVARALDSSGERLTRTGVAIGTPAYMSPEQASGERDLDARSDVYSLGCVLYEMLTGVPPFTGASPRAVISARLFSDPPLVRSIRHEVNQELAAVVARALSREPAQRFATAAEFGSALADPGAARLDSAKSFTAPRVSRRALALAVAAVALLAGALVIGRVRRSPPPPTASASLAVLPFRVVGPNLDLWREGMVDLLSINLDDAAGLRTIHPRTVLSRWYHELGEDASAADQTSVLRVAQAIGARYALTGSVLGSGPSLRLTAEVYDVRSGTVQGRAQIDGSADSVTTLVDRLSLDLLGSGVLGQAEGRSGRDLSGVTTRSLPALKSFLAGEQKFRRGRAREAIADFGQAVAEDSGFALAQYRLALARSWSRSPHVLDESPEEIDRARRMASRLPAREAALVHAAAELARRLPQSVPHLRRISDRYQSDAEVWFLLGDALFHVGGAAGEPPDAFRSALGKAIQLDSEFVPAYLHLVEDAFDRNDSAAVAGALTALRRIDPTGDKTTGIGIAYGLVWGDSAGRRAALRTADTASAYALVTAKHAVNASPDLAPQTEAIARIIVLRPGVPVEPLRSAHLGLAFAYSFRGQIRRADVEQDLVDSLSGIRGADLDASRAARALGRFLVGYPDTAGARRAYAYFRTHSDSLVPRLWLGLFAAFDGRWQEVERYARWYDSIGTVTLRTGDTLGAVPRRAAAKALSGFLAEHRGDAEGGRRAAAEAVRTYTAGFMSNSSQALRLYLAQRYYESGDLRVAERYLESIAASEYNEMPGVVQLRLGRVYEGLGDRSRARLAYGRVVRWWERADPVLQPLRSEARARD
jgi:serine/threonine-protein kinase